MSSDAENRRYTRVSVSIPAKLSVLIPEETFQPVTYDCKVLDISERGAMMQVQIEPETYSLMMRKTRYCRMDFSEIEGLPDKVTGKAVWLQPQGNNENGRFYRIGLFFEDCPAENVSKLRKYVDSIKSQM